MIFCSEIRYQGVFLHLNYYLLISNRQRQEKGKFEKFLFSKNTTMLDDSRIIFCMTDILQFVVTIIELLTQLIKTHIIQNYLKTEKSLFQGLMNFQNRNHSNADQYQIQLKDMSEKKHNSLPNIYYGRQNYTNIFQQPISKTDKQQEEQIAIQLNNWEKIVVLIPMVIVYTFYRIYYTKQTQVICIKDTLHEMTYSLNQLMHTSKLFANIMMIAAQQAIDVQLAFFTLMLLVRIQNFIVPVIIGIFYFIRGVIFLNLQKFPYPPNIIWPQPIIPSIGVPYGITRDFFYSGHTGFMLIYTIYYFFVFKHHNKLIIFKYLRWVNAICLVQVMLVLIITRVHYTIDVIAAWFYVIDIYWVCFRYRIQIDSAFSFALIGVGKIIKWTYKYLKNLFSENEQNNVNQYLVPRPNDDDNTHKK